VKSKSLGDVHKLEEKSSNSNTKINLYSSKLTTSKNEIITFLRGYLDIRLFFRVVDNPVYILYYIYNTLSRWQFRKQKQLLQ